MKNLEYTKKSITLNSLFFGKITSFIILAIIMCSSTCISMFSPYNEIFNMLSIVMFYLIILVYILNFNHDQFTSLFILYIILLIISSLINNISLLNIFKSYYKIMALILYLNMGLKYNCKNIIKSICFVLSTLVSINFITILLFPKGMYSGEYSSANWFLGYKNLHITFYLPLIICNIILNKINGAKKSNLLTMNLAIIIYSTLYCFSANSVVALAILFIYILFPNIYKKIKLINPYKIYSIYILSFYLIVILRIQNIFSWLIVNILHKNLTFTGRTFIWDVAIRFIKNKKILGYGLEKSNAIADKFGNIAFTHSHNTILDLTYKGGIISLIIFSLMIFVLIKKLYKTNQYKISQLMSISFLCIFTMMIFEARQTALGFYIIYIISNNIGNIIKSEKIEIKKV